MDIETAIEYLTQVIHGNPGVNETAMEALDVLIEAAGE